MGGTGDGWDYDALGKDLTPEQFLADPDAQNKIINHHLSKNFDAQIAAGRSEDEAIRRTAATWYSGDPDNADNTTPQTYGAGSYPSIKDYADQVLEKTQTLQQHRQTDASMKSP
ncbi:MAG: hypothetical protein ACR2FS_19490 [Phormidesmis sp.]